MTAWRDVEVAAAGALDGPSEADLQAIRTATFTVEAVKERERVTDHDVAAFVDVLGASAGEAGRWIHYGLTSSDVLDTALALQLRSAGVVIVPGARAVAAALAERAREHADTLCVGRTHGVHAEPTSFGLKLAGFAFEAHRNAERLERAFDAGGDRGDLRRGRHLRDARPGLRAARARRARARGRAGLHPGRPARPPCRAGAGDRARRRRAGALRDRDPPPPAHRGARGRGAVPRGPEGLERDAAQAQPDHDRAHHRPGARAARLRPGGGRERRAVARARHLALRRRARDPARRDDRARLHAAPDAARRRRDDRAPRPHAAPTSSSPAARCSPSACCSRSSRAGRAATTPTARSSGWPSRRGTRRRRCARCSRPSPAWSSTSTRSSTTATTRATCRRCWRAWRMMIRRRCLTSLIYGAPDSSPDLFHAIPAGIVDPFLYAEAAAAARRP